MLANKQDLAGALGRQEVEQALGLTTLQGDLVGLELTCGVTGEGLDQVTCTPERPLDLDTGTGEAPPAHPQEEEQAEEEQEQDTMSSEVTNEIEIFQNIFKLILRFCFKDLFYSADIFRFLY